MQKLNQTLLTLLRECGNAGSYLYANERGTFLIEDGGIALSGVYRPGLWLAIKDSALNDGLYRIYSADGGIYHVGSGTEGDDIPLAEETFNGTVLALRIEPAFTLLASEIAEFNEKEGKPTGYTSESVAGLHSWSKGSGKNGAPVGWRQVFYDRLVPYRRICPTVML